MRALLISTYDLGRQPFGLASAAAALKSAGVEVRCADVSRDRLVQDDVAEATLIGFFLPMHTATRLAVPVIRRVRELNPSASLCAFGLYSPLNARLLTGLGVTNVLGAEFEDDLRRLALGESAPPLRSTYQTARNSAWRCLASSSVSPIARPYRRSPATPSCVWVTSCGLPGRPKRAAAASTAAVTVRLCPSTMGASG